MSKRNLLLFIPVALLALAGCRDDGYGYYQPVVIYHHQSYYHYHYYSPPRYYRPSYRSSRR